MCVEKKALVLWISMLACSLTVVGPALAVGPTSVDPVSWQKSGVGLSFVSGHPTWVSGWSDSSGHGKNLAKQSSFGAPLYTTNQLNGQPILGFGTGQGTTAKDQLYWSSNPLSVATAATGFIVVRAYANGSGSGGSIWDFGSYGSANAWAPPYVWEDFGATTSPMLINDWWMSQVQPSLPYVQFGQWYIYAVTLGPEGPDTAMRSFINGLVKNAVGGLTAGWNGAPTIGDFGNSATRMNVAEILLYDRVLSGPEMNAVVAYLGEKFGLGVAPPIFGVEGGVHNSPQTVTISCATPGATIRYTTDGSDPTLTNGTIIASGGSIVISSDTTLKAETWKTGLPESYINTSTYSFAPIPAAGLTAWSKAGFGISLSANPGETNWVLGWTDASNNGNHLLKGNWAGAPLYKPNTLNGLPILGYGVGQGTTDSDELYYVGTYHNGRRDPQGNIVWGLPICPLIDAKAGTGIMVLKVLPNSHNPPYGGQNWDLGACGEYVNCWNPGTGEIYDDFGATTRPRIIYDPTLQYGQWYIYAVTVDGGAPGNAVMRGYINGVLKGTATGLTRGFYEVSVGDFNPIAHNATTVMNIAEIMLYNRELSASELNTVIGYLGGKFGICVGAPTFSPDGGSYDSPQTVNISCSTPGATIRYTTDGSDPSQTNGTVIASEQSVIVGSDTTLKAKAWRSGLASEISAASYTFVPVPLSGLVTWQKAGTGLSFDPNHSTWVTAWADSSGHGFTATKTSWDGCPFYRPNELNGQAVLGFGDGQGTTHADQLSWLGSNPLAGATAATGFIVAKAYPNSSGWGGEIWNFGNVGSWNHFTPPDIYENFGNNSRPQLIHDPTLGFGTWYIYAVTIGGSAGNATMNGYINGNLKGTVGGLTMSWGANPTIGDKYDGTTVCDIAEVLLYNRVLSGDEMGRVGSYLASKFGMLNTCSISQAKILPDGTYVMIGNAVVSATFADKFYVESGDRSSGIQVRMSGSVVPADKLVTVTGAVLTDAATGERYIDAFSVFVN